MRLGTAFALVAVWGAPRVGFADTWVVPDHYVTIQGAIDASADGDTILVRPGTYVENLLIVGKSLSLKSLGGPEVTIIDGRFPPRPDTLSVVCGLGAEQLLLAGFTLRNGLSGSSFPDLTGKVGGGLLLIGGGGLVQGCVIQDNYSEHDGGGVYLFASVVTFVDCVVRNNQCGRNGGGLHLFHASPRLERCTIEDNSGHDGGALFSSVGSPEFVECTIRRNRSVTGWVLRAIGRYERTIVSENGFFAPHGRDQVGILESDSGIERCTIARNGSYWWTVDVGGVLSHSIVAFNEGRGVFCRDGAIECSDVFGNQGGDEFCGSDSGGNFQRDPLLCSDYTIAAQSPCAPANAPTGCGLIGALGVGCTEPIEPVTWGEIKARWRRGPGR